MISSTKSSDIELTGVLDVDCIVPDHTFSHFVVVSPDHLRPFEVGRNYFSSHGVVKEVLLRNLVIVTLAVPSYQGRVLDQAIAIKHKLYERNKN